MTSKAPQNNRSTHDQTPISYFIPDLCYSFTKDYYVFTLLNLLQFIMYAMSYHTFSMSPNSGLPESFKNRNNEYYNMNNYIKSSQH